MNPADLASAMLLLLVASGGAFMVHRFFGNAKEEQKQLARFAASLAGNAEMAAWGRGGHRVGDRGTRTSFCVEVFTKATMRGGIVDIWHLQKESPALYQTRFALVRPKGEAEGRFDLEGTRRPSQLVVEGHAPAALSKPNVIAALDVLFQTWRVRFLRVEDGALDIGVERVAATITELSQVLEAVRRVVQEIEKDAEHPMLTPPDPDQRSVPGVSGAPVLVPLVTRRP